MAQSFITNHGEYLTDKLQVRVHSDTSAEIIGVRLIVNSPTYRWPVQVGWLEKRRGVTLESKVMMKKREVIAWMQEQNKKIRALREMEKQLNEKKPDAGCGRKRSELEETLHQALNKVGVIDVSTHSQFDIDAKLAAIDLIQKASALAKEIER